MISEDLAKDQVLRLSGLDYFPLEPKAAQELVLAAMDAKTDDVCKKAFDSLCHDAVRCPVPADIRRMVRVENDKLEAKPENPLKSSGPLCKTCQSNGYFKQRSEFIRCQNCGNGREFSQLLLDRLNKPTPKPTQ